MALIIGFFAMMAVIMLGMLLFAMIWVVVEAVWPLIIIIGAWILITHRRPRACEGDCSHLN